jgi:hydrogenase nickel incorporation protein HypB
MSTPLLIDNVGNLVCPTSYDHGGDRCSVLMAVTEGEDKPLKYPTADTAVLTNIASAAANHKSQAVHSGGRAAHD